MPLAAAFGAAAVTSGVHSLWQYNRENYMFDVPLRQSREFQLQNIVISRFGLFREDVRDLAALTTGKVQSYLIVNTLKLGFIIGTFYNYDRTDQEEEGMTYVEAQINLIVSMLLLTSGFWLLTSIWFSMHSVIIAQSLMTKMLVRVVRIPFPSAGDMANTASDAGKFERNVGEAFRVPLLHRLLSEASPDPLGSEPRPRRPRVLSGCSTPCVEEAPVKQESSLRCDPQLSERQAGVEPKTVSVLEILEGVCESAGGAEQDAATGEGTEPHLKLIALLRANWEPFDFYSKVCMEIGTATMLSGLAFFGLYYMRTRSVRFYVEAGGWCTFAFMSVLSWWSLILDLNLNLHQHILVAALVLAGPILVLTFYQLTEPWLLPLIFSLSSIWVLLMCWSGVSSGAKWPRYWRAALYLNVLHREDGPTAMCRDVSWSDDHPLKTYASLPGQPKTATSSAASSPAQSESSESECDAQAPRAAMALLACLELVLRRPLEASLLATVRADTDRLCDGARAAGLWPLGSTGAWRVEGFWLGIPARSAEPVFEWLNPHHVGDSSSAPHVALAELLQAARSTADRLYARAATWTLQDMARLAEYGGEPVAGTRSFIAHFRREGSGAAQHIGREAFRYFFGGVLIVTALWILALIWSYCIAYQFSISLAAASGVQDGDVFASPLPLEWMQWQVSWPAFFHPTAVALGPAGASLHVAAGSVLRSFSCSGGISSSQQDGGRAEWQCRTEGLPTVLPDAARGLGFVGAQLVYIGDAAVYRIHQSGRTAGRSAQLRTEAPLAEGLFQVLDEALHASTAATVVSAHSLGALAAAGTISLPASRVPSSAGIVLASYAEGVHVGAIAMDAVPVQDLKLLARLAPSGSSFGNVSGVHVSTESAEPVLWAAGHHGTICALGLNSGQLLGVFELPASAQQGVGRKGALQGGRTVALAGNATHLVAVVSAEGHEAQVFAAPYPKLA